MSTATRRPFMSSEKTFLHRNTHLTARQAAGELGRPLQSVYTMCTQWGISLTPDPCDISELGRMRRKYYAEDVARMMEMKAMGLPHGAIARSYGMTAGGLTALIQRSCRRGFDAAPKRIDHERPRQQYLRD